MTGAGALQEAIAEQYNDHLRELREAGLTEEASQLREVLRDLRDEERAPEGGVKVCCTPCCMMWTQASVVDLCVAWRLAAWTGQVKVYLDATAWSYHGV